MFAVQAVVLRWYIWGVYRDLVSTFGRTLGSHLRTASFVVQLQREAQRLATEEGNTEIGAKVEWLTQVCVPGLLISRN